MPLVDFNQQATWDSLYSAQPNGSLVHFQRTSMAGGGLCYVGSDVDLLIAALNSKGLVKGQVVAIIGAAFGWMVERWLAMGYGPLANGTSNGRIAAIENSTWIQGNLGSSATISLVNADVTTLTGQKAILGAFNLKGQSLCDWAVTEDVLPALSDVEAQAMSVACRAIAINVAHLVTPLTVAGAQDARLNWKPLTGWKTLIPADLFVQRGMSTVL